MKKLLRTVVQCTVPLCKIHQILKIGRKGMTVTLTTRKLRATDFGEQFFDRSGVHVCLGPNALPNAPSTSIELCQLSPQTSASTKLRQLSPQPSTSKEHKATMVSPMFVYNSLEKCRSRKRIKFLQTQMKMKMPAMCHKLRRKSNQLLTLKSVLEDMKNKHLLQDSQAEVLKTLGASNGELFKQCLLRKTNAWLPKSSSPQLRCFALTLHYYSLRAYEYVREKFNNCLPHPKTISAWYRTVNEEPAISSEAMKSITERVKNTNYPLLGSLMFDEMAIREHVEYDGSKFSGHIDYGKDIACELDIVATQVLVFMIVCLNGSWKVPVAYYFMKGASAEDIIPPFHNRGGYCSLFGLVSNMLKLFRNTLGDRANLLDGDGQHIKWSYLKQLHNIQQNEGMHLGNKLRSAHINYSKQKMKVRLATEVVGKSTADSLLFCKNVLHLNDFKSCEATIRFLEMFNDLFDVR